MGENTNNNGQRPQQPRQGTGGNSVNSSTGGGNNARPVRPQRPQEQGMKSPVRPQQKPVRPGDNKVRTVEQTPDIPDLVDDNIIEEDFVEDLSDLDFDTPKQQTGQQPGQQPRKQNQQPRQPQQEQQIKNNRPKQPQQVQQNSMSIQQQSVRIQKTDNGDRIYENDLDLNEMSEKDISMMAEQLYSDSNDNRRLNKSRVTRITDETDDENLVEQDLFDESQSNFVLNPMQNSNTQYNNQSLSLEDEESVDEIDEVEDINAEQNIKKGRGKKERKTKEQKSNKQPKETKKPKEKKMKKNKKGQVHSVLNTQLTDEEEVKKAKNKKTIMIIAIIAVVLVILVIVIMLLTNNGGDKHIVVSDGSKPIGESNKAEVIISSAIDATSTSAENNTELSTETTGTEENSSEKSAGDIDENYPEQYIKYTKTSPLTYNTWARINTTINTKTADDEAYTDHDTEFYIKLSNMTKGLDNVKGYVDKYNASSDTAVSLPGTDPESAKQLNGAEVTVLEFKVKYTEDFPTNQSDGYIYDLPNLELNIIGTVEEIDDENIEDPSEYIVVDNKYNKISKIIPITVMPERINTKEHGEFESAEEKAMELGAVYYRFLTLMPPGANKDNYIMQLKLTNDSGTINETIWLEGIEYDGSTSIAVPEESSETSETVEALSEEQTTENK